jgi:hypothetical protein
MPYRVVGVVGNIIQDPKLSASSQEHRRVFRVDRHDFLCCRDKRMWWVSHQIDIFTSHTYPETFFEDGAQGTTDHYLLCVCHKKTSIVWFMTSSDDAQKVSDHLNSSPTPHVFSLSELAEAPFKVYVYVQERGDLVVLPLRRYLQY